MALGTERVEVYLAGHGLVTSLGWGVEPAMAGLHRAPVPAPRVDLAPGQCWPLHCLPQTPGTWQERLAHAVRHVVAQTGLQAHSDTALFIASSSLDMGFEEEQVRCGGPAFVGDLHSFTHAVSRALNWRGPVYCFSSACTSALQALLAARDALGAGVAQDALVLGVEMDNLFTPAGFAGLQLLAPECARPFAQARDGLVLGQAVAALHLRTQPTRWRLAGAANVVDGSQPTGAVPQAIETAARAALREAGWSPAQVQLLKPQAAGSPANDEAEAQSLHALFGKQAVPPMVGFKPWIGHCMGASAAVELVLLKACLQHGLWPAELAIDAQPDSSLQLRWADSSLVPEAMRRLLFHSMGFGGAHGALAIEVQAP